MGGNGQGGLGDNLGGAGGGINGGAGGISGSNAGQPGGVGGGGGGAANLGGYGNGGNGGFGGGGGGGNTLLGGIGGFGGGGGGNQTTGSAGGFGGGAGAAWVGGGGAGLGGAIFNDGGTLILLSSTFADNSANGGNGTVGTGATGGGGSGFGGAVFNHLGTLQITNPTFNNNIVVAGTGSVNGNAEAPDVYDLYDLSLSVVGQGSITKDPNQASYFYGQEVTVTATPDEGWSFSAWTGDCAGQGNPCTLTMDGDKTVGATFELNVVSLTINQSTGGTISADPEDPYHYGDVVTVEAMSAPGYTFTGWTNDLSGTTNPTTITLNGDKTVGASFTQDEYALNITQATGGTISASPAGPYHLDDEVTVTATPDLGWSFSAWTGDCAAQGNPCTLTMDGAKAVSASFTQDEYALNITQATGGTISASPAGPYHLDDEVTVTATPDLGWSFSAWTGDCAAQGNPCTLTMDGAKAVSASFTQDEYALNITQATGGTISASPAGPYHLDDEVTVTATPDLGWSFSAWTGDCAAQGNPCTLTMDGAKAVSASFTQDEYALNITQATGGTISASPAGPYHLDDEVTVTATPDLGWSFSAWTGDCAGQGNPCTLTMDGAKAVSASFTQDEYALNITQATGGTISASPAGPYHLDDEVTVTATPDLGWSFSAWTGDCAAQGNPCTLTMDGAKAVSASFTQDEYALNITQATGGTISASPAGPYHLDDEVTVTATPDLGWSFSAWTGDCAAQGNPCTLTMDGAKAVSASFTQDEYALNITQATGGTISASPAGPYHLDDEVTVTATPDLGWSFSAWTGDCAGQGNPCTLTMDGAKAVSASFTQDEYALNITQATGGTISASPAGPYHLDDEVTVTATPDLGWSFSAWTGDCAGQGNPCTLTMDGAKAVSASFTQDEYALNITQATGGTISASPAGPYHLDDEVTVTATPDLGWSFSAWTGDCAAQGNPCTLTMDGAKAVSASFTQDEYALNITQATGGTISASPAGPYHLDDEVTVTATPDLGWSFSAWTGDCAGQGNPCTLTMDGAKAVSASFTQDEYALNITQATGGTISASPAGPYHLDDEVTVTATPDLGWSFSAWTGDCAGQGNPCTLTMDGAKAVSASFTQDEYALNITQATGGTISASPAGPYHLDDEVTVTATPDLGWSFSAWTGDCAAQGNPCTLTMDGAKAVSASFTQDEYALNITQATGGTISASPAGPYHLDDEVTVTATPDLGWSFSAWTGDCAAQGNPCTLTMDGAKAVSASFTQDEYALNITQATGGTISASPAGPYHLDDEVTVTATPDLGWSFSAWTGDCAGQGNPCTLTMDGAKAVSASFTQDEYALNITQATGGTISASPAGPYHLDDEVTVTATPDLGWSFSAWTGDCAGQGNPCTLTMDGAKAVSASFTQDEYALNITQATGGTISASPAGPYHLDDEVTVTATPDLGWSFSAWTGDCAAQGNPCTLTMDGAKAVSASFTQDEYALNITQATGGTISASPAGPYHLDDEVTVTATPDLGWSFSAWTGDCAGQGNPCTLTMDSVKSVSVTFTHDQYILTVVSAYGPVTKVPDWGTYTYGTEVELSMGGVEPGWIFIGWSGGGCSGTDPCMVIITGDTTVTANFTQDEYSLTIGIDPADSSNSVTLSDLGPYNFNDPVMLTPVAVAGWQFDHWVVGETFRTDNPLNLTITGNMVVTAYFTQIPYSLAVVSAHGTVSIVPYQATYTYGQTVLLTMGTVDPGWTFTGWDGGGCSGTDPCTVTIYGNTTVTANFTQNQYTLDVSITEGSGTVAKSPDQPTYTHGQIVDLTASGEPGWTFAGWGGACSGNGDCQVTMDANKAVTGAFTQDEYVLDITTIGSGTVTPNILGPYRYSDEVVLTAVPASGWVVSEWSVEGCSGNTCMVTIYGDQSVIVTFTQITYDLTILVDPVGGGITTPTAGVHNYTEGTLVDVTATPATGYMFDHWSGACAGNATCSVIMDADKSVTANFAIDTFSLTYTAGPNGSLTGDSSQTVNYGEDGTAVTAVPDIGYHFANWSDGVLTATRTDTNVTADLSVTANFAIDTFSLSYTAGAGGSLTGDSSQTVNYGEDGTAVEAVPDTGYHFVNWSDGVLTATRTDTNVTGNLSVTANFAINIYILSYTAGAGGSLTGETSQTVNYGEDGTAVEAVPDTGYQFVDWSDGVLTATRTDTNVTGNLSVTANFVLDQYTLDVSVTGPGWVVIDPDDPTYTYGQEVTLVALPYEGASFKEWGGALSGSLNPITITMVGNISITAEFELIGYGLVVFSDPVDGGMVTKSPDQSHYPNGTEVEITALPASGYTFSGWTGDLTGFENPAYFLIDRDMVVTAHFTQDVVLPKDLIDDEGMVVEDFETLSGWTVTGSGTGYSAAVDNVNVQEGDASIKLTTPSRGNVTLTKPVVWDLSDDQGNFRLWVYVSGASEPSGGSIILSSDNSMMNYFITYYGGAFKLRFKPGWNLINLRTSDWTVRGTPDWASIVRIRIMLNSRSVNTYSFDALTSGVVAQPAVIFTFDKGLASIYSQAFSYMQSRNVRGTGYIPTNLVGNSGQVTWDQLLEMYNAGWTIGNQTSTNVDLTTLSYDDQVTELLAARTALNTNGILNADYVAYPGGKYNPDTLNAMQNLGMDTGRTLLTFNNLSPLTSPYEISQRSIVRTTLLSTAQDWVNTAIVRQEILVITIQGLSNSPVSSDWYISRFQSLVEYCISQGVPIITMDDLFQLQSGDVTIPDAN